MEETLDEHGKSLAAPIIFIIVVAFQFISGYLDNMKKKLSMSATDVQLRAEIKQLLKEASSFSQPSTFAQAAKLRRMAAAKEKELARNQVLLSKEMKLTYDSHVKKLMMLKPFGRVLSWRAGGPSNDNVMVGIIPWLIVSTRVGKFVCQKIFK